MRDILNLYLRVALLTTLFCVCAMQNNALAAGKDWLVLVGEYGNLMKQGQHQRALEVALKSLELAENDPNKDHQIVAMSLSMLGGNVRKYRPTRQSPAAF